MNTKKRDRKRAGEILNIFFLNVTFSVMKTKYPIDRMADEMKPRKLKNGKLMDLILPTDFRMRVQIECIFNVGKKYVVSLIRLPHTELLFLFYLFRLFVFDNWK